MIYNIIKYKIYIAEGVTTIMTLLSIPIYNYAPQEFRKRIQSQKEKFIASHIGAKRSISPDAFFTLKNKNKMIYENYIVGFLNIDFKNDITYKILITESNGKNYKMPLFTSVKHYMSKYNIDGLHTIIYDLSNKEISQEIKNAVNSIISSSEYKKLYYIST